jgi:hypothetical protein
MELEERREQASPAPPRNLYSIILICLLEREERREQASPALPRLGAGGPAPPRLAHHRRGPSRAGHDKPCAGLEDAHAGRVIVMCAAVTCARTIIVMCAHTRGW